MNRSVHAPGMCFNRPTLCMNAANAIDFCGTKTLREASRKQVENFVLQLADRATKDRSALLCQLNNYMRPKQEVVA